MILDFHTHIFPPEMRRDRQNLASQEPVFAALYSPESARMADSAELLTSMEGAGIDISVALGFAWLNEANVRWHNDYLLEAAASSKGRIIAFCGLPLTSGWAAIEREMDRCISLGAKGFGELRPENLDFDLSGAEGGRLGSYAAENGVALHFHASEPVGHAYPGKAGLGLGALYEFICQNPATYVVAAHWGGGLPFYYLMPEVRAALGNVRFDSAATSLLYGPAVYRTVVDLAGEETVLFGSDFPLLEQKRSRRRLEEDSGLEEARVGRLLGENARAFLHLP